MAGFTIGAGAPGGAVALPLDAASPEPTMGLGTAAAGFGPQGYDLVGAFGGGPKGGSVSLGAVPTAPGGARSMGDQRRAGERTQLRATSGLGSAATAGMAPPAAAPSALQSAIAERDGEIGALLDALGKPVTYGRKVNKIRPIVERDAQIFNGGGALQLQPFIPPPPEAGEDEWSYMARVQQLQAEDEQRQIAEAQTLGDVRDIGRDGHLGMAEAQVQAVEGVGAAELQQAERVAEVQRQTAEASRAATEEARAADAERRDFARVQRDAIDQAQAVQADARERLQALPELDPNRSFKSMDGGAKFWAILGSLAGGAIGSNEVPNRLMEIAGRDLETQKANAAQTFDAASAADAGVAQQTGLYRDLLSAAGDEASADAMFLQLQLEDAARELEAQLAETTIPKLQAELQQSLVGVRQQIDAQQRAINVKLATTPESFLVRKGGLGPRSRKLAEKRLARMEEERFKLQMAGIEGEGKFAEKAYDRETKIMEKNAERGTKLAEKAADKDFEIKKASDEWGAVEKLVGDFLEANPGEVNGVGMPLTGSQESRIRTRQFTRALELLATSGFTGATATDRQAEQIKSMVEGDWTELTDEAFRTRMNEIMNIASSRRRFYQDQLGSKDPRIGDPRKGLSTFRPE